MISGVTAVAGLVGGAEQVRASASPFLYQAAFAALSMDWVYVGFPVQSDARAAIGGLLIAGLRGLNVTMPHKRTAVACADLMTPAAEKVGSINTLAVTPDGVLGDNTDVHGFTEAAKRTGIGLAARRVAVLGAGGAARACVYALSNSGAPEVIVAARDRHAAARLAELCQGADFSYCALDEVALLGPEVIINATPLGQRGEKMPFDVDWQADVIDLTYHRTTTPLMEQAAGRGGKVINGILMLVHQAAASFEVITGVPAPVDAMAVAAEAFGSALKPHPGGAD